MSGRGVAQSGRSLLIRQAIRKHGRSLACAIEKDQLARLIPGDPFYVRKSITRLVYLDKIIIYYALNE